MRNEWAEKEQRFADMYRAGRAPKNIVQYIPQKYHDAIIAAFVDSDGYWVWLDHEEGGWVAYDGGEDCGTIHEYTIKELQAALKTIHRLDR